MSDAPDVPELAGDITPERAREIRDSFDEDEQERIAETVTTLLDLLGRAHAMAVLGTFAFADEPLRFSEVEAELDVAPNTLSARLSDLTEAGLLDRTAYDEIPPRVEYRPTEKAEALFPVFAHLHRWAIDHEL